MPRSVDGGQEGVAEILVLKSLVVDQQFRLEVRLGQIEEAQDSGVAVGDLVQPVGQQEELHIAGQVPLLRFQAEGRSPGETLDGP